MTIVVATAVSDVAIEMRVSRAIIASVAGGTPVVPTVC